MPKTLPKPTGPGWTLLGDALVLLWGRNFQSASSPSGILPEHLFLRRVCFMDPPESGSPGVRVKRQVPEPQAGLTELEFPGEIPGEPGSLHF